MKAVVEIFRKDWTHSFIHEVYWEEAVSKKKDGSPTQFWAKQPRFQLRKVATAQAFRLAFPDELGGLPYESAELPETNTTDNNFIAEKVTEEKENVKTSISESNIDHDDESLDDSFPFGNNVTATQASNTNASEHDSDNENNYLENTVRQIENLFETNPDDFTPKHQAWILDKVHKATDNAGIKKMLAYTEKVIKKAA